MIETPRYDLTLFKIHFGNLTLKAYTKGEHVLRFEAVAHNTRQLRCGRVLDNFPTIIDRLAGIVDRFTTTLDCVDVTFIGDGLLDQLPAPAQVGATRVGGVDLNKPRIRAALSAVLALAATSAGFTVAELTAKVHTITGNLDYTIRQAAYDLRKLRGKDLITKPGRTRRYHLSPQTAGTIAALLTLREQVIGPILAGVPQPTDGAQARHLDPHRPRLREDPHRHADPLPRPGHPHCRIDNILSIGVS